MEEPKDRIWNATMTGNHNILWWLWTGIAWRWDVCWATREAHTKHMWPHMEGEKKCTFGDCFIINLAFICTTVLRFIRSSVH